MITDNWPNNLPRPANQRLARVQSISPWFELYKLNNVTFAFLEPYHCEQAISYLIIGEERAVLFDTGMGISNIRVEVEQLTNLPVIVINSHSHYDHIGGNACFNENWVYDDNWEVGHIERGYSLSECKEFMQPNYYIESRLPAGFDLAAFKIHPSQVTRRLHRQESIELGDRILIVHHTPGETPGSICLQDTLHGILFTGDTIYPGTLWAHLEESNFNDYLQSLKYLVSLLDQIVHLSPAHNEVHVSKELLIYALKAFEQIAANLIKPELIEGTYFYRFKEFNVRLPVK